mgnify:CR=1 FL=1
MTEVKNNKLDTKEDVLKKAHQFKKKSQAKTVWIRYKRNKLGMFGLIVFCLMAVAVLSANGYLDYFGTLYVAFSRTCFWY